MLLRKFAMCKRQYYQNLLISIHRTNKNDWTEEDLATSQGEVQDYFAGW